MNGRYDDALESFTRALRLAPEHLAARDGLGSALTRLGRFSQAVGEYERILAHHPSDVDVRCNFAELLLRAGDVNRGLKIAEDTLAYAPHHQLALALWGTALRQLGDAREEELNDYGNFVQIVDLDPPEGFRDMADFNNALNAYLDRLHWDRREHINQTSRLGTKTAGMLFGANHELVERLKTRIDEAVGVYIARLKENGIHPLHARRGRDFLYSGSWSTRLSDCGFHTNHVHPMGWISSAYYVSLPDAVQDETAKQGWLKFGEPSFDAHIAEPVRRTVRPVPGRLMLFPSYMWHGTVPFHSQQPRTSIAFDVVPGAATGIRSI